MIHFSRTWWWFHPLLHFAPFFLHILLTHWLYLFWKEALTHFKCDQKIAGGQVHQPCKACMGLPCFSQLIFASGQWIGWIINKHLETLGARYHWSWAPRKRFTGRSKVFIYGGDPRLTPRFAINCVTLKLHTLSEHLLSLWHCVAHAGWKTPMISSDISKHLN